MSETKKYKFNLEELKKLNLPDGNYSIAIRAKNNEKKASLFSKLIEYRIMSDPGLEQLAAPTISISGDNLQIADNSGGLATSFDILVNGMVKQTISAMELITFNIGNALKNYTCYAEQGMTWNEWVESEYNTDGFYFDDAGLRDPDAAYVVEGVGSYDDEIIPNGSYLLGKY